MSTPLVKVKVMRIYAKLGWQLLIANASAFNVDWLGRPLLATLGQLLRNLLLKLTFCGYAWLDASILLNLQALKAYFLHIETSDTQND